MAMETPDKLYERIFDLPQTHQEIRSIRKLTEDIHEIIELIKELKLEGRLQDI